MFLNQTDETEFEFQICIEQKLCYILLHVVYNIHYNLTKKYNVLFKTTDSTYVYYKTNHKFIK